MTAIVKQLWNDESGATAVEYGIMVALIAAVIITTVVTLGKNVDNAFKKVNTEMKTNIE